MIGGIKRVVRIELVHRIGGIIRVKPIDGIERIIGIKPLGSIERIIGTVLIDRLEDVVVAFIPRIKPGSPFANTAVARKITGRSAIALAFTEPSYQSSKEGGWRPLPGGEEHASWAARGCPLPEPPPGSIPKAR